jgi:ferritin
MYKLFDYVNETGAMARVGPLETPKAEFASILDVFKLTLEHEQFVTGKINDLTDVALSEKDFSTFNFLQWYVAEQHEEEALFKSIIDKLELVGTEGKGIFLLDREMSTMHAAPAAAESSAAE